MYVERHERAIARSRLIGDKAAVAILEADRRFVADPTHTLQRYWMGLRWSGSIGPREAVWHA